MIDSIQQEYTFKKINNNINYFCKALYPSTDRENPNYNQNEVFFSSSTNIISYNFQTSFIVDKYKINEKNIKKFIKIKNNFYCLNIENEFSEYDILSLTETKKYQFKEKINNFVYSEFLNNFIFISNEGTLIYLDKENFKIEREKSYLSSKSSNNLNNYFMEISSEDKMLITNFSSKLIIFNLTNFQFKTIDFKKPLSSGIFLDDRIVVGDISGKIHVISNIYEKYIISTKHWHAHKVNTIETDANYEYLYTAGEEGVIVIWNLKTDKRSFLPRLNAEIKHITISPDSKTLAATLTDNSIKFVNLFNNTIMNSFDGLSLEKEFSEKNIRQFNIKNEQFLLTFANNSNKIQILNCQNGRIVSNDVLHKNFISRTEREKINNKQLVNVTISQSKDFICTYEEITDENDKNFLISYLKFWKVNNLSGEFTMELLSIAENSHNNEKINVINSQTFMSNDCFVTMSQSSFKIWSLSTEKERYNFHCSFVGSYKKENVTSVSILDNAIYSIHSNNLIEWDIHEKCINNNYILPNHDNNDLVISGKVVNNNILIHGKNTMINFSIIDWEILWSENFSSYDFEILNVKNLKNKNSEKIVIFLKNSAQNNDNYIIYQIDSENRNVENCVYLQKNNLRYVNISSNTSSLSANSLHLILINKSFDVYVTKKKTNENKLLGNKTAKSRKEKDTGIVSNLNKQKKNVNIEDSFEYEGLRLNPSNQSEIKVHEDDNMDVEEDLFEKNLKSLRIKK